MPLDAASSALLAQMSLIRSKPLRDMSPAEARECDWAFQDLSAVGPDMLLVEDATVESDDGAFDVRLFVPQPMPHGIIVYYDGGGWVLGEPAKFDRLVRMLAATTRCAIVLVDYRLAPEHPFPVPVKDSYAALQWVDQQLGWIAGRRVPLIVAGDSAGGNLATVVARRARDGRGPAISAQVLAYPVTDCDFETGTYREPDCQRTLTRDDMLWFWDHYLPLPSLRLHPDASPMRAASLRGMPPTLLLTAECDPFRDEGEAYAAALKAAAVPVELSRYAGQMHGFLTKIDVLPSAEAAIAHIARFVTRQLACP